ncbi:phosphatidylinositol transfer protein csr1, partial [Coemansia sp. RSA 1836]
MSNPVLDQYAAGKPATEGTLGNLTASQDAALRDLWRRLLAEFPNPANSHSADEPSSLALSPGISETPPLSAESAATTATKRSSRLRQASASPATTPTSAEKSRSGSWFSFGMAAKAEPASYRQLVGDVAADGSRPPERYSSAAMARAAPTMRDAFWDTVLSDHPDVLLLRFLRARKWKPEDALAMLLACLRWRLAEDIDWLLWTG